MPEDEEDGEAEDQEFEQDDYYAEEPADYGGGDEYGDEEAEGGYGSD